MGVTGLTTFIKSEPGLGITKPVDIGQAASSSPIKDQKVLIIDLSNFSAELLHRSVVPFVLGKVANLKQELRAFLALLGSNNITPIFRVEGVQSRNQGGLLAKRQWKCVANERSAEEVFDDVERALRNPQNFPSFSLGSHSQQIMLYLQ